MNSRMSDNTTNIKQVFLEMMQNLQNISKSHQGKIGNLSIVPNMANLQIFPKNFGNLNKFSIAPSDNVANSARHTALSHNTTSNRGSGRLTNTTSNGIGGLNARSLSYLIGTSGAALARNAVTGSELNEWCKKFEFQFHQ